MIAFHPVPQSGSERVYDPPGESSAGGGFFDSLVSVAALLKLLLLLPLLLLPLLLLPLLLLPLLLLPLLLLEKLALLPLSLALLPLLLLAKLALLLLLLPGVPARDVVFKVALIVHFRLRTAPL